MELWTTVFGCVGTCQPLMYIEISICPTCLNLPLATNRKKSNL